MAKQNPKGRRSKAGPNPSRRPLLGRAHTQVAANVLMGFYALATVASLYGFYRGLLLFVSDLRAGAAATDGSGAILGIFLMLVSLVGTGVLAYLTNYLRKAIAGRQVHRIRGVAFLSLLVSIVALLLMLVRDGTAVLAEPGQGALAVTLIAFTFVALTTFAVNRSLNERF